MEKKKWYLSKTMLIAFIQAAICIVVAVQAELPLIGWLGSAKSVMDIILRIVTSQPVK